MFDEIAHGGMATVHLGRLRGSAGFSRVVAVKKLHAPFARDPEFVSMFVNEAQLAARIQHPNVVPVLDVIASQGELFIVMEYVHGETFAKLLTLARTQSIPVPPANAVFVIAGMLHGLHAAHEARSERGDPLNIVHRDVSPQNVLVGIDGVSRVLDFGIAKATQKSQVVTRDGVVKGKLHYMSPEQVTTGRVDRRTDIYAASVMLWEALTGVPLFESTDVALLIAEILAKNASPPSRVANVPRALDAIVMRGLARDPAKRYATARQMARDLESAVPAMSPLEVAAWVGLTAEGTLKDRVGRIAAIEAKVLPRTGHSDFPPPPPSGSGAAESVEMTANPQAPTSVNGKVAKPVPSEGELVAVRDAHGVADSPSEGASRNALDQSASSGLSLSPRERRAGFARRRGRAALLTILVTVAGLGAFVLTRFSTPALRASAGASALSEPQGAPSGTRMAPLVVSPASEAVTLPIPSAAVASVAAPSGSLGSASGSGSSHPVSRTVPPRTGAVTTHPANDCIPPYTIDDAGIRVPIRRCY